MVIHGFQCQWQAKQGGEDKMISVRGLRKRFPNTEGRHGALNPPALDDVSFDVPEGSFFTLLGPSGCGKTTTLRSIAGLQRPDSGSIRVGDVTVFSSSPRKFVPPEKRGVGMVFQSYAIWPHMTVFENVAYPLRARRVGRLELAKRVGEALEVVGLGGLGTRPAPSLSGGQQQRVALARAIVGRPRVLLLDEPLSNLDAKLRDEMRVELRRLQVELGLTAVYVTHDQQEALGLSDLIAVMGAGRLLELGTPQEVYLTPRSRFAAEFIGRANFVSGRVQRVADRSVYIDTPDGTLVASGSGATRGQEATAFFRPENVRQVTDLASTKSVIPVRLEQSTFLGEFVDCRFRTRASNALIEGRFPLGLVPPAREDCYITVDSEDCRIVDDDRDAVLSAQAAATAE
jgi:iron(III) transport system ATP-binding protein